MATGLIMALLVFQCIEDSIHQNNTYIGFIYVEQILFAMTGILCMLCLSLLICII